MANTNTLRSLLNELRLSNYSGCTIKALARHYIFAQCKELSPIDQQLCKARDEVLFMGRTYLTYLSSQRKYNDLRKEYHGSGERTVRETANMVGFKLPIDKN